MSASFRSRFRHPQRQDEPTSLPKQRKPSSRIPTRLSVAEGNQGKVVQHVSKLAEKANRTSISLDKVDHGADNSRAPVPMAAMPNTSVAPKRISVALSSASDAPHAGSAATLAYRLHGPPPPPPKRTPSLVSGSSVSTFSSPASNMLRKKPSNIEGYAAQKRAGTAPIDLECDTMHSGNERFEEPFEDSLLGISLPPTSSYSSHNQFASSGPAARLVQDSKGREWNLTREITPPVLNYAPSATPSTRYTDSPFSLVPTPSSASSYEPSVVATSGSASRPRQRSPTRSRPPPARRPSQKADTSRLGLPPVRESSTSSSSSTVKPVEQQSALPRKEIPWKPVPTATSRRTTDLVRPPLRDGLSQPSAMTTTRSTSRHSTPMQIPPELAHLNVDPPSKPALNKALPPARPSRDGTPSLTGMNHPSPIVQSDLPRLYTSYHKRTPSQETSVSASSPTFTSRFGMSPKASSKQPSPRVDSAISPPPSARPYVRNPTPELPPEIAPPPAAESRKLHRRDSPAIRPTPSPSKSPRFGIFSRKPKGDSAKTVEKSKRQVTKGPVAGTGHEGYGRFGLHGRSGSTTSSAGVGSPNANSNTSNLPSRPNNRKGSTGSSKDGSELDDFLRERLNPVVLRGSGSTFSNSLSNSDVQGPSVHDSSSSSLPLEHLPKPRLLPSAMSSSSGISSVQRPQGNRRKPSDSSEDDVTARYPSLAARRSLNRLSQADGKLANRLPAPINTTVPAKSSPIGSCDTGISTKPQSESAEQPAEERFAGKEGAWLRPGRTDVNVNPARKWNFFQRAQASPRPKGKGRAVDVDDLPEPTAHQPPYRSVAHYAMIDPVEPLDLYEVEQIIQENETSFEDSAPEEKLKIKLVPYERRHASLLPSPAKVEYAVDATFTTRPTPPRIMVPQESPASPELVQSQATVSHPTVQVVTMENSIPIRQAVGLPGRQQHTSEMQQSDTTPEMPQSIFNAPDSPNSSPRQSRLSPIGRIPRVVSKRDRDRKLPDQSFSRPFARTQPHPSVKPPGALYTSIRELASPVEGGSQPVSSTSTRSESASLGLKSTINTEPTSVSTNRTSAEVQPRSEFISFTPRKDSDVSYSSSSGKTSLIAALATTAPQLDDPWQEYNDLVDEMILQKTSLPSGSSLVAPFQYASMLYDPNSPSVPIPLNFGQPPTSQLPAPPRPKTVPASLNVQQQIARFMQPSLSPLTSATTSDLLDQYGNRSSSTPFPPNRANMPAPLRTSLPYPEQGGVASARASISSSRHSRTSGHSRSASLPEVNDRVSQASLTPSARFRRDTQLLDIAEDDGHEQASNANLRFGALMTSKWLSFGRVLFSPAHNEMRLADEPRVLVLDGLGSDWSYYVAFTYPGATVYNLGPTLVNGSSCWPGVNQRPPSNHRHIPHSAISAAIPFPKGFFTAVVFRFPVATTEQAYQACIFECKRVLRPGGYLEVAVLDLDLMNMGNKARRELRWLKTRMQRRDQDVSLRNMSDVLVRLVGRRGFEEVQRCIVGVPAAGRIPRSQDISSVSSINSGKRSFREHEPNKPYTEWTFADLLEDATDSQVEHDKTNDEGITKMVAQVGRWWYSKCYETALLRTDRSIKSIWDNPTLLRECEKQGTSFRLLICFAQKPAQTRRRTVSV